MFLDVFICLPVYWSVLAVTPKLILKFFMLVGPHHRKKGINFGKDADHILNTKKKSQIFRNVSCCKPTL